MKQFYQKPELTVVNIAALDILLASGNTQTGGGLDTPDNGDYAGSTKWNTDIWR